MLITDNLPVRKNYFNSNIVQNENARLLGHFSKDYFEVDINRSMFTYDVIKMQSFRILKLAMRFITNFHMAPFSVRSMGKTITSC